MTGRIFPGRPTHDEAENPDNPWRKTPEQIARIRSAILRDRRPPTTIREQAVQDDRDDLHVDIDRWGPYGVGP